jgi:hypothetical protein
MKSKVNMWKRIAIVMLIAGAALVGCIPPGAVDRTQVTGAIPAGLAQAYNDAGWELLSEDNGTFAYRMQPGQVPAIAVGDQIVHGNELREVVAIIEKTDAAIVVHTTTGNMAKLFPANSTLSIDTETMTATVDYPTAGRSVNAAYTVPVVLKQMRETQPDGSSVVTYDNSVPGRAITLIDQNHGFSIINKQLPPVNKTIFSKSGNMTVPIENGSVTINGSASLSVETQLRIALNCNIRLYMSYDAGVNWVPHTTTTRWWLFGWHTTTTTWYEAVPWQTVHKDLKASISGSAECSAYATLSCNGSVTATYSAPLPFGLSFTLLIAGVVPVEIGYAPKLNIKAVATGALEATIGAGVGLDGEFGVKCDDAGWGPINRLNVTTGSRQPGLSAGATLSIVPEFQNEIRVGIGFSNTGVYGTFTLTPYLDLNAATGLLPSQRTWNLSCGIAGDVGVKASVCGYDLGAYNARIFDFKKVITSGTY